MHFAKLSWLVHRRGFPIAAVGLAAGLLLPVAAGAQCTRTLTASVVALDQVFFWNRLGAVQPQGQMFALRRDVVPISGSVLAPGNVRLRSDKRPRPLVLRMNVGDCLRIDFQNLLSPLRRDQDQSNTRQASIHVVGLQWFNSSLDDGSYVGRNPSGLTDPGQITTYTLYAEREGEHVLFSMGAPAGGEGDGGQANQGLFGALIVEPAGARWYRSQVTRQDLDYATTGYTATGQRKINYEALYPIGHPRAGTPVLNMVQNNQIMHSDLTAIIAGPQANYEFATTAFPANTFTLPRRFEPFREFTIIYHDEIGAVQAFPVFEQNEFKFPLHSVRDGFAINYGTGGAGAEILANRFRVGPMWNCPECKYEEFFLTSWAVGDPAMVVDRPANVPCGPQTTDPNTIGQDPNLPLFVKQLRDGVPCVSLPNPKATKAFFPDDPSNVYHSYLRDHTKFRVLHGGSKEHHIHHLHAHQWLFAADSDKSSYLDSQALGPGSSFTAEITYEGSGNLNLTAGDSIFHCHFYPHFAQGMWSLWRVHDVFEEGTNLDANGRPAVGSRALPDGEIAAGTPIPGVVPLPNQAMAPLPGATVSIVGGQIQIAGAGNPGFPFFIPAKAGHRPPSPPLDTIDDGGLRRHIITAGAFDEAHTRTDFHKTLLTAVATELPEGGTATELAAMAFHAVRQHPTCLPDGTCDGATPVKFITNGRPAVRGAPFADPCVNAEGVAIPLNRRIKGAAIETDVVINKRGWHFPQMRFEALWDDVDDYITPPVDPPKPPEPLFMRANSRDCIEYWYANLVPHEYQLDDFQVRTPTDILGQHIHLVKFDVTSSDGSGNGYNYEDGSLSPGEVRERINAIRTQNGCTPSDPRNGTFACPLAEVHPFFGPGPNGEWIGAQTTVQRWYADPVLDNLGNDRTLRTVFTHDHFGPSTHQQAGLYAGLVIEPYLSNWFHNETGVQLGTNAGRPSLDGGPTSWQAVIEPPLPTPSYREFMFEFADFQLAYEEGGFGFPDPDRAVNPPGREDKGIPKLLARPRLCPDKINVPPCPEAISAAEVGTMSVNYRQEPIALRVRDPLTNGQATVFPQGDLSYAFASIRRADDKLNIQPPFYQPLTEDIKDYDPYTPLLRAYENDRVQVRILVGAHEEGHNFNIHGIKWLFEPAEPNSGYRNSQMMGISEHFEFIVPQLIKNPQGSYVDRLYSAGSSTDDLWNGIWGLFRAYTGTRPGLKALRENPNGRSNIDPSAVGAFDFSCPKDAVVRPFDVTAVTARYAIPGGRLVYNSRADGAIGPLFDPTAILFVRTSDLVAGRLASWAPIEPLVLRARAGECIKLTLRNNVHQSDDNLGNPIDLNTFNMLPMTVEGFNENEIKPSSHVGLHPQLLYYDVSRYDGANVGGNATQTVAPGQFTTYQWYAGDVTINADGTITATPIEFGATNLMPSDRIEHPSKGAFGSLIIEPVGANWTELSTTRAVADVTNPFPVAGQQASFREFVLQFQNDVNLRTDVELTPICQQPTGGVVPGFGAPIENLDCGDDAEDSGGKGINYRTEPLWKRMQHPPGTRLVNTDDFNDWFDVLSNTKVGGEPKTPLFTVAPFRPIRFRLLQAGGHSRNIVFELHGHVWDREPYISNSTKIGRNSFSMWTGAQMGIGPSSHFEAVIRNAAGGRFSVLGDYLFRNHEAFSFDGGMWGILRVTQ